MKVTKYEKLMNLLNIDSNSNLKTINTDETIRMELIRTKFSHCGDLVKDVEKLRDSSDRIKTYAHEYDLDQRTPYNGHRSLLKIAERFENLLLTPSASYDQLDALRKIAKLLIQSLENCEQIRTLSPGQIFCDDEEYGRYMFDVSTSMQEELAALYGSFNNFWLCRSMKNILNYFYVVLVCMFWRPLSILRTISDSSFRGECFADYTQNVDLPFVKSLWHLSEIWFYRVLLPIMLYGFGRPTTQTTVYADTRLSNEFVINPDTHLLQRQDESHADLRLKTKIRCRFLRHKLDNSNETLLVHIHGAGFVAQTPDSHDAYLRGWSLKLRNIPILSIDYSLLPEAPFPIPFQEVLDVYLWLTSPKTSKIVQKTLGFVPKKFVFAGDSAGASLCISLAALISDARKLIMAENVELDTTVHLPPLPSAIVVMYPAVNFAYSPSASKIMCAFETFLSTGVILDIARHLTRRAQEDVYIDGYDKHGNRVAWYQSHNRHETISKLSARAAHPYLSSINYQDFESLRSVKLYMISGEFDAMLDDSIALGRKWRGQVILDVMPDMPHGFLYFLSISGDAKLAADHCAARIVEACKND